MLPTECSSSTTGIRVVSSWPQSHRQLNQQHATLPANIVRGSAGKWPLTWLMFVRACRDQLDISYSSVLPLYALHKMHWWNQTAYSLTPGQVCLVTWTVLQSMLNHLGMAKINKYFFNSLLTIGCSHREIILEVQLDCLFLFHIVVKLT